MVYEQGRRHLPIACRYVPYDQWFITHIDPTWKIKHLKQRILSKCLNLPFDSRFIQQGVSPNARPPSPITFAPDASVRPDSPVRFAALTGDAVAGTGMGAGGDDQESTGIGDEGYEGYEEDDEWEQDFDIAGSLYGGKIGPNVKAKSKSSNPTTASPSLYLRMQQKQKQEEQQITTHIYTLFRFSTGQILEEDFQISWYDIQPHELVELHPSFSPPTFSASLLSPMSIHPPPSKTSAVASSHKMLTSKKKKSSSNTTTDQGESPIPSVVALPRHVPNLYVLPYWQGWVRALSVLLRTQTVRADDEVDDNSRGGRDERGEGGERRNKKLLEKIEWKESWVVIHDGVVNLCRSPTDRNPIRLLLSSLVALRGPEHLADSVYAKNGTRKPPVRSKPHTSEPSTIPATMGGSHTRPGPSTTSKDPPKQVGKGQETVENLSNEDPKRNTRNLKKTRKDGKQQENGNRERESRRILQVPHHSKSSRDKDRDKTFIPTSREEAEQAGMRVVCAIFRAQPAAEREWDKMVGDIKQAGGFPKARRYTSTGPSLALVAASGPDGVNTKTKGSTGPHVVIDSDVYVGETPSMEVLGRHQPQPQSQSQRTLISSSQFSLSGTTTTGAAGTDPVTNSPISHPTGFAWNLFGSKEKFDLKERKTTERHGTADDHHGLLPPLSSAGEDFDVSTPAIVNSLGWKCIPPSKLKNETSRSTELGDEDDVESYAAEPSDMVALSSSMTSTRPTVVTSGLAPVLPAPTTATVATISPESQSSDRALGNPDSGSDSSISISSPVFAHENESDLDDDTFLSYGSGGGGGSGSLSNSNRPRKGYRYGGYHVQAQMVKAKSDHEGEDERLVTGDGGIEKEVEVEVEGNLGDGSQAQQATPEENEQEGRNEDQDREVWITLDMINDNAFNSILRILHRHSPLPLSSSFTPSHSIISSPISSQSSISNKSRLNSAGDLHHGSSAQVVPSDTDDDSRYVARNSSNHKAIHPPILESLAARTAVNHSTHLPLYVALPYPEWRLEVVNRARRAGMREIGRPLDLALHGWGREFEEMAAAARERKLEREKEKEREKKDKRKSAQSHVSTIKERKRRVSRVIGGSEADDDYDDDLADGDEEEEEAMRRTQLDSDSEEESDTEWLAWMTDLPRQFLVQQQAVQTPQHTPSLAFTNPFSSSSTLIDGGDNGSARLPRTQEEERLLHADKLRKLEPSAISTVIPPPYPPSPTSNPFADPPKQIPTPSSFESLHHQRNSSNHSSTPFPGVSLTDDPPVNTSRHSRSQSRSLQHLGSYRQVGSVPEEGGDGYNPASSLSSPSRQGLHHSVSVDQNLSSRRNEVISRRQSVSATPEASEKRNKHALGKHILTNEQIMQIESEVVASAPNSSLPSHWTFPPIHIPSPPPNPPSTSSHTPSHMSSASTSTSTTRPPSSPASFNTSGSTGGGVEVKAAPMNPAINRFTSSELARWSSSVGISLPTTSLSTPSSPSASTVVYPNSASPPRSSVFGSLGRSPSLLGKVGGQEKEKKGFLRKRMSRDLGKEKEKDRDAGECAPSSSLNQRPRLVLSSLSSSTSSAPHRNYPYLLDEIPTHNPNHTGSHHSYHSASAISSARALLRRVRSGSSLRGEENSNVSLFTTSTPSSGLGVTSPETESKEVQKKKKGPIDRIVRGFDSSLAFAEGR